MKRVLLSSLKLIGVWLFWIVLWFLAAKAVDLTLLLPSPLQTLSALWELIVTPMFWQQLLLSFLRILSGIVLSLLIGTLLAVLTTRFSLANTLLMPLINMMKSVPVASFIVLACLWIDTAALPVLITALIVIPIVCSNVSQGILSVDKQLSEVTVVFQFSPLQRLTRLYIPTVFSYFMAACRSSIGMAWKAGIAAEILAPPLLGIGKAMYIAKTNLDAAPLFAWTLVIVLFSYLTEKLLTWSLQAAAHGLHWNRGGDRHAQA